MKIVLKIFCSLLMMELYYGVYAENTHLSNKDSDVALQKKFERKQKELQILSMQTSIEKLKFEQQIRNIREEIEKLKVEKELDEIKHETELTKKKIALQKELVAANIETEKIKAKVEKLKAYLEKSQQELQLKTFDLEKKLKLNAIESENIKFEMEKINQRAQLNKFISGEKKYPDNPLRKDGILMISDRIIPLNGMVSLPKARFVAQRISYYNNDPKYGKKPIFIIIDVNIGGSVSAGADILDSIEASKAPVHIVVKSMAASMAAIMLALAKGNHTYVLSNAQIMHHQPILAESLYGANTEELQYLARKFEQWSRRFLGGVAKKMGISLNEFIRRMHKYGFRGNWEVFGDEAKKLKWVKHVVKGFEYTNIWKYPEKSDYTRKKFVEELWDIEDVHNSSNSSANSNVVRGFPGDIYFIRPNSGIKFKNYQE